MKLLIYQLTLVVMGVAMISSANAENVRMPSEGIQAGFLKSPVSDEDGAVAPIRCYRMLKVRVDNTAPNAVAFAEKSLRMVDGSATTDGGYAFNPDVTPTVSCTIPEDKRE